MAERGIVLCLCLLFVSTASSLLSNTKESLVIKEAEKVETHVQSDAYAFSRGQIMVVVTSLDKTFNLTIQNSPYDAENVLRNVLNPTETFRVSSDGSLPVILNSGDPLVLQKQ